MNTPLPLDEAMLELSGNVAAHVKQSNTAPGPLYNDCCRWTRDHGAETLEGVKTLAARVAECVRAAAEVTGTDAEMCATEAGADTNHGVVLAALDWQAMRVAELERELSGVREASATEIHAAYKRVAELEGEIARAKWDVAARNAHANALRDALVKARDLLCEDGDWLPGTSRAHECITAALIATPAASLAAYRKSVLEEAAKECEHGIPSGPTANEAEYGYNRGRAACASDIRAIAAHPANTGEVKP